MLSEGAESEEEYTRKKDGDDARESQSNLTETDDSRFSRESRMDSVESDLDPFDFGSTASLASSISGSYPNIPKDKLSGNVRASRLDPAVYRKHRERNISLRLNLSERLLKPVIATSIKKMDKLSQNISNYQLSIQDALFQSRVSTSNLLKLQKQLEKFCEANYLEEIRTDDDDGRRTFVEMDDASDNSSTVPSVPL